MKTPYLRCAACGEALPATSPRADCRCGGLLDVVHEPRETGAALRSRFDRRRRDGDPAVQGSGVWRFREVLLPGRGPVLTHPEGNTLALPPGRDRALGRPRRPRPQARGREPHRLLQGPRHDGGGDAGGARGRHGGGLRLDREHLGLDGRLRGAGGAPGARVRPRGEGGGGQARPGPRLRRAHPAREGRLRRLPAPRARGLARRSASPSSTRSTPGAWRARRRSSGSCCSSAAGSPRLDRRPRRQPRQHRRPSARRCARRSSWGSSAGCRASPRCRRRGRAPSSGASGAASGGATACGRRRSPRPFASATRRATTGPSATIRETRGLVTAVTDREILEAKAVVDAAGIGCEPASAAAVAGARRLVRRGRRSAGATPWSRS